MDNLKETTLKETTEQDKLQEIEHDGLILSKIDKLEFKSFDDMEFLSYELLRGIFDYGFKDPSRIQNLTIKKIHDGVDIVAQSQSGTGKTGAFCIGALSRVTVELRKPQVLIIANTGELAGQIFTVIKNLAKFMDIHIELCIGGHGLDKDDTTSYKAFNKSVASSHVLVCTPGKLRDIIKRGVFRLKTVKLLILDEADVLMANNFVDQIREIFIQIPDTSQTCIYSATYDRNIIDLAKDIMKTPELILLPKETLSLELIKQYRVEVGNERFKYATLRDIYKQMVIGQCIIFVNTKDRVDDLTSWLTDDGYAVGKIHGRMTTHERSEVIKDFRIGKLRVLISTDILSRGIDIQQIGIVINYDLPRENAEYIHRIGRSGRFNKIGIAINFVTDRDERTLDRLESHYKIKIVDMPEFNVINEQLSGLKGHLELSAQLE